MTAPGIVVVGAGPAGMRCAERIAATGRTVTLIGEEPAAPYDRVALSRYLAREVTADDLTTHRAADLESAGIRHLPGTRVTAIDRSARHVSLQDGPALPYTTLVLTTGATSVRLDLPGASLPGVLPYRTLADVQAMIDAAAGGGDAVVIGGGLLGLEAASGLAERGMRVTVLHAVDRLMERQLDHAAARRLACHLAARGIASITEARTVAIEGTDRTERVRLADGRVLPARLVVMAVGIRPNTTLAREAGLPVGRGVLVDDAMRTADPAILAAGECAEHDGQCVGLVLPALAQAEVAARTACGQPARYRPATDAAALKVAGAPVWSAGEIDAADADSVVLDDPDGAYRRLLLRDEQLIGAILYGAVEDAPWYMRLIRQGAPVGRLRDALPFGPAYAEAMTGAAA
ncbi:MAG: NAD(P)/FAD-dependent oxidoreductase [Acetobacteraceae bacterium]